MSVCAVCGRTVDALGDNNLASWHERAITYQAWAMTPFGEVPYEVKEQWEVCPGTGMPVSEGPQ